MIKENPFRVLGVSIYDTKTTIVERADDLSFAEPDREKIFAQARDILLNPRKRIAAEFRELAAPNFDAYLSGNHSLDEFGVSTLDRKFSALNAESLRRQINAARVQSKFPAVQDTAAIRDELKNLRDVLRESLQGSFKRMNRTKIILLANDFANAISHSEGNFGVVVEDFFDGYRMEITPHLVETTEKISSLLSKIKINTHAKFTTELAAEVQAFAEAIRPLDKFSAALGTNDFAATEELFYAVRSMAIELFNAKNLINDPLILIRMLEKNFSYLPPLAEVIRTDIIFLEETQARQPSQAFLHAKDKFEQIQAEIDRKLHFANGFGQSNIIFYEDNFKPIHERTLRSLMVQSNYKPAEWSALNAVAATIYLQVGSAMTWARRADLAFELFRKALPYAEASGEAELISIARKRVNEWNEILRQIDRNKNSGGCLSVVAAVAMIFLLAF